MYFTILLAPLVVVLLGPLLMERVERRVLPGPADRLPRAAQHPAAPAERSGRPTGRMHRVHDDFDHGKDKIGRALSHAQ